MSKKKNHRAEATKDMSDVEKDRYDREHSFEYIVQTWGGGEHIRAATLAAEAEFDDKKLEDLAVLCPGIKDHMPAGPGEERQKGTVPGDPARDELQKFQMDESEVADLTQQNDEKFDADAVRAKRTERPGGKPDVDPKNDGPTIHPEPKK